MECDTCAAEATYHQCDGCMEDLTDDYEFEINALLIERDRYKTALEAIRARIKGEWDNPALVEVGPLCTKIEDDIEHIAYRALTLVKGE